MNEVKRDGKTLRCICGAKAKDTSKERARFLRRHPVMCSARATFTKRVAAGVRSVEDVTDEPLLAELEARR